MQANDGNDKRQAFSVTLGLALLLLFGVGVASVLAQAIGLGPQVGDIVTFRPGQAGVPLAIVATRTPAGQAASTHCVLNPAVLATRGGSLVVEELLGGSMPHVLVHWAGGPTSRGRLDCGRSAELLLSAGDLRMLMDAADGDASAAAPTGTGLNLSLPGVGANGSFG